MSNLTYNEKMTFEKAFGMKSGYVLDFSDRTFREFIRDSVNRDIDDPRYHYASNSKANRLRKFWDKESNELVAKLMSDILDYLGETGPTVEMCRAIVARLLQGTAPSQQGVQLPSTATLLELREEFCQLALESDRRKAGLGFELFLNRLFAMFHLRPRQPFRVVGEQVDGSFELDSHIYLLELKWEHKALSEAPLLVFRGKIEGKSTFTRGVFIAVNGITNEAHDAITRGKSPCFFVMNGHDLMMVLNETVTLTDFLRKRVRLLAEEGRVCVPFDDLR